MILDMYAGTIINAVCGLQTKDKGGGKIHIPKVGPTTQIDENRLLSH